MKVADETIRTDKTYDQKKKKKKKKDTRYPAAKEKRNTYFLPSLTDREKRKLEMLIHSQKNKEKKKKTENLKPMK